MKPSTISGCGHRLLAGTSSGPVGSNHLSLHRHLQKITFPRLRTAPLCFPLPASPVAVPKVSRVDSFRLSDNREAMNYKIALNKTTEQSVHKPMVEEETSRILSIMADFLDSLWIFKVFKPFGLTLPPIILAFILYGGLKAFLVSFTVCLGVSVVVVAFETVWRLLGFGELPKFNLMKRESMESKVIVSEMISSNGKVDKSEYGGWGGQSMLRLKPKQMKRKAEDMSVKTPSPVASFDIFRQGGKVLVFLCLLMTVSPLMYFLI